MARGWSDYLRLPFAALAWNARKSLWILTGRKKNAPCLNPSDPHGPLEARCDACLFWQQPARFALVCPLLARHQGEWRCTPGRAGVRPFWGRFLMVGTLLAVLLGSLGLGSAYALLLRTGVRDISPLDLVLPSRRPVLDQRRAEAFLRRSAETLQSEDQSGALLSLATAHALDPANLATGLALARFASLLGHHARADALYSLLNLRHPDHGERLALHRHDSLLINRRWESLARLALESIPASSSPGAWLQTLALAASRIPSPSTFTRAYIADLEACPSPWREAALHLLDPAMPAPLVDSPAFTLAFNLAVLEKALADQRAAEAWATIDATLPLLGQGEALRLQLRLTPPSTPSARRLHALLVPYATADPQLRLELLADLVTRPDPRWLQQLAALSPPPRTHPETASLWLLAQRLVVPELMAAIEEDLVLAGLLPPSPPEHPWQEWTPTLPFPRPLLRALAIASD